MNNITEPGWAIRRDTNCIKGAEVDCGVTVAPWRGCCPVEFSCPTQYNVACCPSGTNCTLSLIPEPSCSNATWDLFDNGGYFCCEPGWTGYNLSNSNGCTRPDASLVQGAIPLKLIKAGIALPSSSSAPSSATKLATVTLPISFTSPSAPSSVVAFASSSASSIPTPASESTAASSSSSGTPVGAIAGGVVGGVGGIALLAALGWFFLRRKPNTSHAYDAPAELQSNSSHSHHPPGPAPVEKYAHHAELERPAVHEIGSRNAAVQLPTTEAPRYELAAAEPSRKY